MTLPGSSLRVCSRPVDFDEALIRLGFELAQDRPAKGLRTYAARPNRFLTYWVHAYGDGSALFTWDERGPQDPGWLAEALNHADERLRSVDFANPQ